MWESGSVWRMGTVVEHHRRSAESLQPDSPPATNEILYLIDVRDGGRELKRHSGLQLISDAQHYPEQTPGPTPGTVLSTSPSIVGIELQNRIDDLLQLVLTVKQCQWCVMGGDVARLPNPLDSIVAEICESCEKLANRLAAMGITPLVLAAPPESLTVLGESTSGGRQYADAIDTIRERLVEVEHALKQSSQELHAIDPLSEGLLVEVASQLDQQIHSIQSL